MIYIDMDGVIANFSQSIIDIYGEEYSNKIADDFWKATCVDAEVFRLMPPIPEGIEMVRRISAENDICFMTSTGGIPHHIDIAKQKLDWLRAHGLGEHPVAFCMNTVGKGRFAGEGKHLIDDREKVLYEWRIGGGIPHLFTRDRAKGLADFFCARGEDNA